MEHELSPRTLVGFLSVLVGIGLIACGRDAPAQSLHPLLKNLPPPTLNRPLKEAPVPKAPAKLPPGTRPTLLVTREGRAIDGTVNLSGRLTVRNGQIDLLTQDNRSVQVLFRLPPGVPPVPEGTATGDLSLVDLSDPGGPNHRLVIRRDNEIVLAHVSLKSLRPVSVDLGEGLRIRQRVVTPPSSRSNIIEAPVDFGDLLPVRQIPVGRGTANPRKDGSAVTVFVTTSHCAYSPEVGQQAWWYLFEAWVVRSKA